MNQGFKVFCVCDSRTKYLFNFEIYTGKVNFKTEGESLPRYIVKKLCIPLEGKGYHIYTDRWYTSPILFAELQKMGIGATGTVGPGVKGLPESIIKRPN